MATIARTGVAPRTFGQRLTTPRVGGYLLVLPAVIYVLALIGFPLVLGIWYSLTDVTVATPGKFIGFQNFVDVAKDPTFRLAARIGRTSRTTPIRVCRRTRIAARS